jgi:uncharacterized protein (DUF1330 family)
MKGYLIALLKVSDMAQFMEYQKAVGPLLAEYGAKMIAKGAPANVVENDNVIEKGSLTVIFEFESLEKATAFYDCEAYKAIIPLREICSKSTFVLLPGTE